MNYTSSHSFHIPVMGLGFTIDSPVKVARFGISSVVSIIQHNLLEQMREFYCKQSGEKFIAIHVDDLDHRAKRVTAYLDLIQRIIDQQIADMKVQPFKGGTDLVKYFELLPPSSALRQGYDLMQKSSGEEKVQLQLQLREEIVAGAVDVNIMTKVDNLNYSKAGEPLPMEYSDAISALRGFADSSLQSSVVFSAGLNPRLFAFLENLPAFVMNDEGYSSKKIILKVSDYRSAMIQGKFLAKKGLWVSEFRVESGLNCGGHAFPTEGYLLGPILEEFKMKKAELRNELAGLCSQARITKGAAPIREFPPVRISVQGGIGTSSEHNFLRDYYNIDATGWGSPFLLVPEATNLDDNTLEQLVTATQDDYFLSHASPLGVPFNNFRKSSSEAQRKTRIEKNRPGSPCYKKHLAFNTEFTKTPICVASREYQQKKLQALQADTSLTQETKTAQYKEITSKDCLCEGLTAPALLKNNIKDEHRLKAVTICPGPNLAYFSGVFSLEEMVGHIYGRVNILNSVYRPHMFINELKMYVDYFKNQVEKNAHATDEKQEKYLESFRKNLLQGIEYYKNLLPKMTEEAAFKLKMKDELELLQSSCEFVNLGTAN